MGGPKLQEALPVEWWTAEALAGSAPGQDQFESPAACGLGAARLGVPPSSRDELAPAHSVSSASALLGQMNTGDYPVHAPSSR